MSYEKPRIQLTMTVLESVVVLSEGNPGAVSVMARLVKESAAIDPDSCFGGLGPLMDLDVLDIYGARIWMFYKDVCGEDLTKLLAVLRANQLGQLAGVTEVAIVHAIDNYGAGLDVDAALAAVMDRLPSFAPHLRTKLEVAV